jgi:diadenosine tetraphosphate (Ap4A) HIT family hydrolase
VSSGCALCVDVGGLCVAQGAAWRVVRVLDDDFPAYYRVIWGAHVGEFSELPADQRRDCLELVVAVEQVLRARLHPTKVNLASLGNVVPHLHWHVVARFAWDSHFPNPIWAERLRPVDAERAAQLKAGLPALDQAVSLACGQLPA